MSRSPIMNHLITLILSLACLHNTHAVPVPAFDASTCTDVQFRVDSAEAVAGKTFLSSETCKNDFSPGGNPRCKIGTDNYNRWAVVPLVSKNLVGASATYNLSQIANDANSKLSITVADPASAAPGQLTGGSAAAYCDGGADECGLTVTPRYIHVSGTRIFGPACQAPQPSEPYEMWLPILLNTASGAHAQIETAQCNKGDPSAYQTQYPACPDGDPWAEQVVPNDLPPGPFAKISSTAPHGSGLRFRVRFNSDSTEFGVRGQDLLAALNEQVFRGGKATALAGNWQEWADGLSDIADFNFDAPGDTALADTCSAVAETVGSVSGIALSGYGICDNLGPGGT
ncbi:MAG: hypothetical protein Q9222_004991 [Ikaeria aurantiellina]